MVYTCEHCSYSSKRLLNLNRHLNRKKPCNGGDYKLKVEKDTLTTPQIVGDAPQIVRGAPQIVRGAPQIVRGDPQIVRGDPQIVGIGELSNSQDCKHQQNLCSKCGKVFQRRDNMKRHEISCNGVDPMQCGICKKIFASRNGKHEHMKYVKCLPPQTDHINQIVHTNSTFNTNTFNINVTNVRLDFGKECLSDLCNEKDYQSKIMDNIESGKYALVRSIDDIFFNDKYPSNQTLKKERRNDKIVEVYIGGKWEKRLVEDVFKPITSKIERYHKKYFLDLCENSDQLMKQKYELRKFGHQMLWYGWSVEMFEKLGYILNYPEDEEEKKKRMRDIKSLIMERIYDKSQLFESIEYNDALDSSSEYVLV